MTAGGLTAKQMAKVRAQATARQRAETAMMYRAAGYLNYEAGLAKGRERSRQVRASQRAARTDDAA